MSLESPKSKQEFLETLAIYNKENKLSELAFTKEKFGDYLVEFFGEIEEAAEYYYLAFNQYRRIEKIEQGVLVYWKAAQLHTKNGQFERAIGIYNKILEMTNSIELAKYHPLLTADIGDIYRVIGNMTKAKECILGSIEDMRAQESSQHEIMSVHTTYIKYLLSNYLLDDAAIQIQKIENQKETISNQIALSRARYYILCDELPKSEKILKQIIELPKQWNMLEDIGLAFLNMSLLRLRENNYLQALKMTEEAYLNLSKSKSWRLNESLHLASRCYLGLGRIQESQESAQKAMQGYLNLSLYERINHVEQTLHSQNTSVVDEFGEDELMYEFSNFGI